jgi:hypothetical protein
MKRSMAGFGPPAQTSMSENKKSQNARTALILALIAAGFFVAVFVKRIWFS